jgi:ABC-type Fe3+/spermidine/putrescine transport system ATPase subunit
MRITLRDITKRFGKVEAVRRAAFSIEDGEMFTLLGPSGCGKTTLLRIVAGFYAPDEGEILFGDRVVTLVPPHERGIGMVFQNYALWPHMTVAENVAYGLKLRKIGRAEIAERVGVALERVGLAGLDARYPGQLSGGQQQRVALARALVLNPAILLLDEPLSNLDAKIRVQVRAEIRKLQKELGITTVYVTHDQEEALTLSDRIAVFDRGSLLQIGPPQELYERPASRFIADFIGINNLLDGRVESVDGGSALRVATQVGTLTVGTAHRLGAGDRCVVCVRPENARLRPDGGPETNRVDGKVAFAAYLGNTIRYDVDVGRGIALKVDVRDTAGGRELPLGTPVTVAIPASGALAIPAEP